MKSIKPSIYCYNTATKRSHKDILYIVIHYTANKGDTAEGNCKYYSAGGNFESRVKNGMSKQAGAAFFIDRKGNIVKSVPMNRIAYSVGGMKYTDTPKTGGGTLYKVVTNANSVSIELCDIVDQYPSQAQIEAVKKVIKYIRRYCKNAKTLVRHFDVNGKHCPAMMMDNSIWKGFLKDIDEYKSTKINEFKVTILEGELNIRKGPSVNNEIITVAKAGETYTITDVSGSWGKLKNNIGWINISPKYVKKEV